MKTCYYLLTALLFLNFSSEGSQKELIDISNLSHEFAYDIRYATTYNFMGEAMYDCAKCLLRPEVAEALVQANNYFCEKGYKIKLYDCYRPLDVQKKMWAKVPNPSYVANPYGNGSVHNRGAAIDLTLVTLEGCYVEMGTDYDFFGRAAHIDNNDLPSEVLANRKLLIDGMRAFGFQTIRTEWWHFSFQKNWQYATLNTPLPCAN